MLCFTYLIFFLASLHRFKNSSGDISFGWLNIHITRAKVEVWGRKACKLCTMVTSYMCVYMYMCLYLSVCICLVLTTEPLKLELRNLIDLMRITKLPAIPVSLTMRFTLQTDRVTGKKQLFNREFPRGICSIKTHKCHISRTYYLLVICEICW